MKMKRNLQIASITLLAMLMCAFKGEQVPLIGNKVNDFRLKGTDDKMHSLASFPKAKGFIVIFTCDHCPFAKLYTQRLNDLNTKYKPLGVPLLAINPMDSVSYEDESFSEMKKRAASEHFNFPYLYDQQQSVAKNFKANRTPHAFIIWKVKNEWVVKYDGAIDNNGKEPAKATPFVANGVDELLKGKEVSNPETSSIGCAIYFRK